MTTNASYSDARGDFRCGLCRQKGAFHCEHDTPYRDIYLGTFDPNLLRNISINAEKPKNGTRMHNNLTSNSMHSNAGAQYQQGKRLNNTSPPNKNTMKQTEQDKKSKSCTIL
ncbi:unnamed protein product [Rotaria sp. Silwood2]|nr:unnamed protein product [Rotaria sp. Silwood2]CAF3173849.1 unnamed protein product [Rotaria sp. Silwood2]CAF3883963.1 unnamed protein product [Rotaria sp. Silwood2]CAF4070024.1 unnamed protein product [Rotaria sp. Silwood2]